MFSSTLLGHQHVAAARHLTATLIRTSPIVVFICSTMRPRRLSEWLFHARQSAVCRSDTPTQRGWVTAHLLIKAGLCLALTCRASPTWKYLLCRAAVALPGIMTSRTPRCWLTLVRGRSQPISARHPSTSHRRHQGYKLTVPSIAKAAWCNPPADGQPPVRGALVALACVARRMTGRRTACGCIVPESVTTFRTTTHVRSRPRTTTRAPTSPPVRGLWPWPGAAALRPGLLIVLERAARQ